MNAFEDFDDFFLKIDYLMLDLSDNYDCNTDLAYLFFTNTKGLLNLGENKPNKEIKKDHSDHTIRMCQ